MAWPNRFPDLLRRSPALMALFVSIGLCLEVSSKAFAQRNDTELNHLHPTMQAVQTPVISKPSESLALPDGTGTASRMPVFWPAAQSSVRHWQRTSLLRTSLMPVMHSTLTAQK